MRILASQLSPVPFKSEFRLFPLFSALFEAFFTIPYAPNAHLRWKILKNQNFLPFQREQHGTVQPARPAGQHTGARQVSAVQRDDTAAANGPRSPADGTTREGESIFQFFPLN